MEASRLLPVLRWRTNFRELASFDAITTKFYDNGEIHSAARSIEYVYNVMSLRYFPGAFFYALLKFGQ